MKYNKLVLEKQSDQSRDLYFKVLIRMCEPQYNFWERTPMAIPREPLPSGLDKFANEHRDEFQKWLSEAQS